MLWVNANIATESRSGVLDIFSGVSTTGSTVRTGIRILRADVLEDTNRLRIRVSARFPAADAPHYAFLLRDHPPEVHNYVFRVADAAEGVFEGDLTYEVDFTPAEKIEVNDQWDWALVDLRLFRLAAVMSTPPADVRWRLTWRARFEGASQPFYTQEIDAAAGETREILANVDEEAGEHGTPAPGGGVLQQVVTVEDRTPGGLQRGQEYAVLVEDVSGCIIHGERAPDQAAPMGTGAPLVGEGSLWPGIRSSD